MPLRNAIRNMAESEMAYRFARNLDLYQLIPKFLEEKITPDIVCKLSSSYEFRLLVIADSSKYTPQKLPSQSGALKV